MDARLLEETGLTRSEIMIYTALLERGSTKIGELVKDIGLHRSRVYDAMNRLAARGLVSYVIKNNVKHFEASDPEQLVSYIEEQKAKLEEKKNEVKRLIPELRKKIAPLRYHSEAHVFSGNEGFKAIRRDIIRQGKKLYLIGAVGKEDKALRYFFPSFDRERIKKKIKWKILYEHGVTGDITRRPLMETRFLPKEYSTPAVINVYSDRVVNVLWEGEEPTCFMIINKEIADSYRKWFNLLWKYSRQ